MEVEGIILAAGMSSRAKTFKMALQINGKTIIENAIDSMLEVCKRIVVVGGYRIEKLQPVVEKYDNVELIFNEEYEQGMFSSVIKGMSCIREDRFFFTPGDFPLISPEVYRMLIRYEDEIVIPVFEGKKGHPILFRKAISREILEEKKYKSLRDFIRDKNPMLVPVSCRGILMDVDTIEDYRNILQNSETRG